MNCFHFVSLKYWTQLISSEGGNLDSCELLSFCIFEILNTVSADLINDCDTLWIAFILYLWNIEHSTKNIISCYQAVVNCFHFVSLKYWTQWNHFLDYLGKSCELLSFCIFEILNTVPQLKLLAFLALWIAFILYLWNIEHSPTLLTSIKSLVVNCFHFVSLKYWTQCGGSSFGSWLCCELLSFCIFEILNTVSADLINDCDTLWIAFILYLWNIEHSAYELQNESKLVVNCFHFVSLKYWTQWMPPPCLHRNSCELLSFCIFEILNTV